MGLSQRNKGKRGERGVVALLRNLYDDALDGETLPDSAIRRTAQNNEAIDGADVISPDFLVECKSYKAGTNAWSLGPEALRTAEKNLEGHESLITRHLIAYVKIDRQRVPEGGWVFLRLSTIAAMSEVALVHDVLSNGNPIVCLPWDAFAGLARGYINLNASGGHYQQNPPKHYRRGS